MSISIEVGKWSVLPCEESDGTLVIHVKKGNGEYVPVVSVSPDGKIATPLPELDAYFQEEQA